MGKLESELAKAFKNSGFGDVNVRVDKMGLSAGYAIEAEMSLLIRIMKSKRPRLVKAVRSAVRKSYKIVRKNRQK